MKRIKILLICLIGALCLSSCTDWKVEYQNRFTEAAMPVMEKYNFCKDICEKVVANNELIVYDDMDELNETSALVISLYLSEEMPYDNDGKDLNNLSNALFVRIPNSSSEYSWNLFEDDGLGSYYYYEDQKDNVYDRESMEDALYEFNEEFVDPLKNADYFVVVEDLIKVRPKVYGNGFYGGCFLCQLTLYDLGSFEEMDSYFIATESSERVVRWKQNDADITNYDLEGDLRQNLEKTIIQKLVDESPVRFKNAE